MNGWRLSRFGRRWANHRLQARPGFAWLFVVSPRPGLPEPDRSPKTRAERAKLKSRKDDKMISGQERNERRPG